MASLVRAELILMWVRATSFGNTCCRASLQEECPKYHGHKRDPEVTPGIFGAGGERAQMILVWIRALGVENVPYPCSLEVMRVRP